MRVPGQDGLGAGGVKYVVVLRRMTPPAKTMMSSGTLCLQCLDDLRHQGLVAGGERRAADGVDVVLDGEARGLLRRLEERADVDIEAEVGGRWPPPWRRGRGRPGRAWRSSHARATAFFGGKLLDIRLDRFPAFLSGHDASINTRNGLVVGAEAAEDLPSASTFADRGAQADRLDG